MADNNEEQLLTLAHLGITETEVLNIPVKSGDLPKQLASRGKIKAVILRLNQYQLNTTTNETALYFYVGLKNQVEDFEVLRGTNSQIFFIDDMSKLYIRIPMAVADGTVTIRAMIYK